MYGYLNFRESQDSISLTCHFAKALSCRRRLIHLETKFPVTMILIHKLQLRHVVAKELFSICFTKPDATDKRLSYVVRSSGTHAEKQLGHLLWQQILLTTSIYLLFNLKYYSVDCCCYCNMQSGICIVTTSLVWQRVSQIRTHVF